MRFESPFGQLLNFSGARQTRLEIDETAGGGSPVSERSELIHEHARTLFEPLKSAQYLRESSYIHCSRIHAWSRGQGHGDLACTRVHFVKYFEVHEFDNNRAEIFDHAIKGRHRSFDLEVLATRQRDHLGVFS